MAVVVGAVPTPEGRAAVRAAVAEARTRRTCLVVVPASRRAVEPTDEQALAASLDRAAVELTADGLVLVREPDRAGGDLADELVAAATAHAADCIVIGLRRRSPVGKLMLGGNAQRILLEAPCPVLAVKAGGRD